MTLGDGAGPEAAIRFTTPAVERGILIDPELRSSAGASASQRFLAHREQAERLYDARFAHMWEFYLAAAEMAFREQAMMVFQLQLTKHQGVVPMTRDYIGQETERLRDRNAGIARPCGWPASDSLAIGKYQIINRQAAGPINSLFPVIAGKAAIAT
jgi:hypothetical protein